MLILLNVYTYPFCGLAFSVIRLAAYTYHQGQCQGKSQTRGRLLLVVGGRQTGCGKRHSRQRRRTKPVPVIKEFRVQGSQKAAPCELGGELGCDSDKGGARSNLH